MKGMESHHATTKSKLRDLEEKNQKLEGHMLPKLKETIGRQKDVAVELEQIHLDA